MLVDCKTCQLIDKCNQEDRWYGCINHKPKTMTNADKIRSMTDEELAETFDLLTRTKPESKDDTGNWLDWLKQESK